jgi:hypothetical protein
VAGILEMTVGDILWVNVAGTVESLRKEFRWPSVLTQRGMQSVSIFMIRLGSIALLAALMTPMPVTAQKFYDAGIRQRNQDRQHRALHWRD